LEKFLKTLLLSQINYFKNANLTKMEGSLYVERTYWNLGLQLDHAYPLIFQARWKEGNVFSIFFNNPLIVEVPS